MLPPLAPDYLAIAHNLEGEAAAVTEVLAAQFSLPDPLEGVFHGEGALAAAKPHALSPGCMVL